MQKYIWSILIGLAALFLFTRHNQFPWYYHPDEPGKVEQVLTGDWNYNHPMLLLSAARAVTPAGSAPQVVVEKGRMISALFAAISVGALSLLAWNLKGRIAGLATGLLLATHHQPFELSHYMKEDTALLVGVTVSLLALHLYERRSNWLSALFLGAGCGLAASGKYIGAVMLVPAILLVIVADPQKRRGALVALLAGFVITVAIVNWPLLQNLSAFQSSFGREMEYVVDGQKGMTKSVPHSEYLGAFRDNTTPVLWGLLGFSAFAFWKTRREQTITAWITFLFPFLYTIALSFSPKANDRYFLVCTVMFVFLCGIALPDAAAALSARFRMPRNTAVIGLVLLGAVANVFSLPDPVDWPNLSAYVRAFQVDDRADLRRWVEAKLPADAVIAQDNRAGLPPSDAKPPLRQAPMTQKVVGKKTAASLGTLEELRRKGVGYVVASQSDYGRYFRSSLKPKKGAEDEYQKSRSFYEQLFREGNLLWKRDRGTVIYLHPGIEVYEIATR